MPSAEIIIDASNIHYSYQEAGNTHTVLAGINLAIQKGEIIALLGESGSGKSTLLNLLGGIDAPVSGSVRIQDQLIFELDEPALTLLRRAHIGFIYQLFNLIPTLTVFENIALPLELAGVDGEARQRRVGSWLSKVGLGGRETAFPDQLSGGEQQRVAVARALIHEPSIVLADEPTGNLDVETGHKILDLLTELARENKQTLLIVTHSIAVTNAADRVFVLDKGMIREGMPSLAW